MYVFYIQKVVIYGQSAEKLGKAIFSENCKEHIYENCCERDPGKCEENRESHFLENLT